VARRVVDDEPGEEIVARAKKKERPARRGPFSRIATFIKEVVAELKKVVTPTRKELVNYTAVVLAFVVVMIGIVYLCDWVFGMVVVWAFGGGSS